MKAMIQNIEALVGNQPEIDPSNLDMNAVETSIDESLQVTSKVSQILEAMKLKRTRDRRTMKYARFEVPQELSHA